jgi:hypothetical protein
MITHRKILGIKYICQERKLETITFLADIKKIMNGLSDGNSKQTDSFSFLFLPASQFTLFTVFPESLFTLYSVSGRKSIPSIHCF